MAARSVRAHALHDPRYTRAVQREDGVVASALRGRRDRRGRAACGRDRGVFTAAERAYARVEVRPGAPPRRAPGRQARGRAGSWARASTRGHRGPAGARRTAPPVALGRGPRRASRRSAPTRALVSLTHGRDPRRRRRSCCSRPSEPIPARRPAPAAARRASSRCGAALYLALAPAGDEAPHPFNQDRNAVWLEHRWLERDHSPAEMDALFSGSREPRHPLRLPPPDPLRRRRPPSGPQPRADAGLPAVGPPRRAGDEGPALGRRPPRRLPAASAPARWTSPTSASGSASSPSAAASSTRASTAIHVNVEPVDDGNVDFLALLRALRTAVGGDRILSLSAIRPGPFALPVAPNFFWTPAYYARVGGRRRPDRRHGLRHRAAHGAASTSATRPGPRHRHLGAGRPTSSRARVLLGMPTYDETGLMHRAGVETPGQRHRRDRRGPARSRRGRDLRRRRPLRRVDDRRRRLGRLRALWRGSREPDGVEPPKR